jgi:hypothetical protein
MLHHFNNYKDAIFKAHNTSINLYTHQCKVKLQRLSKEPTAQSAGSEALPS